MIKHLSSYYSAMPDPRLQGVYRDFVPSGVGSKSFLLALDGWKRQFAEMNTALASSDWLVGNELTLSDLAYLPYMCRIEHLHMRFGPAAQPWRAGSIVARRPRAIARASKLGSIPNILSLEHPSPDRLLNELLRTHSCRFG